MPEKQVAVIMGSDSDLPVVEGTIKLLTEMGVSPEVRVLSAHRTPEDVNDFATREILESILKDEDAHIDWIEEQQDQIEHMGIQIYLANQTG